MQKKRLLFLFVGIHLGFIMLQIHKQGHLIKLSYAKQKVEQEEEILNQKRENLMLKLHALKAPDSIRYYAKTALHLEDIRLEQIKKLEITS